MQNAAKSSIRGQAYGSIRIQEGEPHKIKYLADLDEPPRPGGSSFWQHSWQHRANFATWQAADVGLRGVHLTASLWPLGPMTRGNVFPGDTAEKNNNRPEGGL